MTELVKQETVNHIALITLNQPETRNAISELEMVDAIIDTVTDLNSNTDIHAAILTGAGTAFSSGGNLKTMGARGGLNDSLPAKTRHNYINGIQRIPLAFESLELPIIAAVNGPAIGAGLDLACMCDIRIASTQAVFAESFVKVGLVPGDGGAWLLPRVVGFARASEMALTGEAINADEALQFGLISRVVRPEDLLDTARSIAQKIAANPVHAVRLTKKLLREGQKSDLTSLLQLSAAFQAIAHETEDHDEAVAAMLEKRDPTFKGC